MSLVPPRKHPNLHRLPIPDRRNRSHVLLSPISDEEYTKRLTNYELEVVRSYIVEDCKKWQIIAAYKCEIVEADIADPNENHMIINTYVHKNRGIEKRINICNWLNADWLVTKNTFGLYE